MYSIPPSIPTNLLTRDLDSEATNLLSAFDLERYFEGTKEAREKWAQRQANYEHLSSSALFPRKHPWRPIEAKAAAHYLEYQAALWAVFMSLRTRAAKALKD